MQVSCMLTPTRAVLPASRSDQQVSVKIVRFFHDPERERLICFTPRSFSKGEDLVQEACPTS